jgi:hypothetical protein
MWQRSCTSAGTHLDAGNVRRIKDACKLAGTGTNWTPRELRTSFVSLMSHSGVRIVIPRLKVPTHLQESAACAAT